MKTNAEIMQSIREWQHNGKFHPLTCGVDSRHRVLEPVEKDGKVVLVCPDCDYVQSYIPGCVAN